MRLLISSGDEGDGPRRLNLDRACEDCPPRSPGPAQRGCLRACADGSSGAAVGSTGLSSTGGSNIDVYQFIVLAEDAFSQVAVRGLDSLSPTFLPPGEKSKSDPHGQRGYAGTIWWKAVLIENNGWMAVGNVGVRVLT